MPVASEKRLTEVMEHCLKHGEEGTCKHFNIGRSTLQRYKNDYKGEMEPDFHVRGVLKRIQENYTEKELEAIAKGAQVTNVVYRTHKVSFEGDHVCFAHFTDTHMGSIYFVEKYFLQALEECEKEGVQFICHTGDVFEGMSKREGHVYELTHIGGTAQKDYGAKLIEQWKKPWYMIDGNHDRWILKSAGILAVKELCDQVENAHFLGHDEGDLELKHDVTIKLWHGEDGSSYATSYRIQKIVESFSGGEKPNILLAGHTHKQIYMFERNIQCVSGGALSKQSKWMRSKRHANHMGFHIIHMWLNKTGVTKFSPTWYPFYA